MKVNYSDIRILNDLTVVRVIEPEFTKVMRKTVDRDNPRNKGKDPIKDNMIMKEVEEKVTKDLQVAEVLNIAADNKFGIKVGDLVVVNFNRLKKFDMWSEGTDTEDVEFNVGKAIYGLSNYEIFGVKM